MKPTKIVHAYKIYKPEIEGGIPEVISTLVADSNPQFSHSILVARKFGLSRSFQAGNAHVTATSSLGTIFSTPVSPTYPLAFSKFARQADVVVHHAPFPLSDLAIAADFPDRVGLIIYWHADVVGRKLLKSVAAPFINSALQRADKIIVSNRRILDSSEVLTKYSKKCSIVPFGTDLSFWGTLNSREAAEVERLKKACPRLVIFIGRLVDYKGIDVLIDAISQINAQLVVIGDGPLREKLAQQTRRLEISDRVSFCGKISRDNIKVFLHAGKLLCLPSRTIAEAYGLVQMEAMAAGCPVVNTDLPTAVPDIARHDREGLTVPRNNPLALAQAINAILDDPLLRSRLSNAAKMRASSEYCADTFRSHMASVYEEVLATRSRYQMTTSS